jgi:hypothetical protein
MADNIGRKPPPGDGFPEAVQQAVENPAAAAPAIS